MSVARIISVAATEPRVYPKSAGFDLGLDRSRSYTTPFSIMPDFGHDRFFFEMLMVSFKRDPRHVLIAYVFSILQSNLAGRCVKFCDH